MRLLSLYLLLPSLVLGQDSASAVDQSGVSSGDSSAPTISSIPPSSAETGAPSPSIDNAAPSGVVSGVAAENTPDQSVTAAVPQPTVVDDPLTSGADTNPQGQASSLAAVTATLAADPGAVPNNTAPAAGNDTAMGVAPPTNAAAQQITSGSNTPPGYAPGSGPGCDYCTVPEGFTSLDIPAPLRVQNQFTPKWQQAHTRAAQSLRKWSLEDKVNLATGVGWMQGRCVGNTPALPQHGWKGLCMQDSPLGPRFTDHVSAMVPAINAAATFDKSLMYARGKAMGYEFRKKGIHVALGPMTNMGRVAAGGRNWEGPGGDPYLSGHFTAYTVWGIQDMGVQACVKHFIANEQEANRTTSSSNIDDRTLREVYAHPFLRAVQADVASVMCSYNLVNGSWGCQNAQLLNGLLKTDYGFGGYVMSDWNAQHSGVLSANNGLDMTMPGDIDMNGGKTTYWGEHLVEAVKNGSVVPARLNDMAQRIMAAWYLTGQDQNFPDVNFDSWSKGGDKNQNVDAEGNNAALIRQIGAASVVLLKNTNKALPLKRMNSMAVIGSDMGPAMHGPNGCGDHGCLDGTLAMGWGSGTVNFPYLIDPLQALQARCRQDHTDLNWWLDDWDTKGAANTAASADIAIVGVASDSGEGYITVDGNEGDRRNLSAWHNGDEIIKAVAAVNKNTVVVVHSVGPMDVEQWIDHPNVTAVVWAGLPGQESGNSLVDVLYGLVNPSGRLPYTIAKKDSDYPAQIDFQHSNNPMEPQVEYTEKLNIDYRHFLANNIEPRFPFGFGMSYSTFDYSNINVAPVRGGRKRELIPVDTSMAGKGGDTSVHGNTTIEEGSTDTTVVSEDGNTGTVSTFGSQNGGWTHGRAPQIGSQNTRELHRPRWTVSVDVTNSGGVNGWDAPQLYLSYPSGAGEPPRVLRDFERINLNRGDRKRVQFKLSQYDVSIWDVTQQKWVVPSGEFTAVVSHSATEKGISATFTPTV